MTQANWSEDRVEQLKTLWTEGLSASQIARALGGVTRNAVIGKVHRLGLAGRASPSRSERPRLPMAPKAPSVRSHLPAAPVVEEDPLTLEDGSHATVLTISDRMCRWPIGDPAASEFHFCGRSPKSGSPYCEAHARKAYQPQQAAPRDEKDNKGRDGRAETAGALMQKSMAGSPAMTVYKIHPHAVHDTCWAKKLGWRPGAAGCF